MVNINKALLQANDLKDKQIKDLRADVISKAQEISKLKYKIQQLKGKLEDAKSKLHSSFVKKEDKVAKQKNIKLSTVIFSSIVDSATQNTSNQGIGMLQKRIFMMNRENSQDQE